MGEDAAISGVDLPDGTSEIFLRGGLDDPNQLESPHEIPVLAHAICTLKSLRKRGDIRKIELICPCRANQLLIDPVRSIACRLVRTESWK